MSDRRPMTIQRHPLPAAYHAESMPSPPTSSGAWWGPKTRIMRKDTEFVRTHDALTRARTSQTEAVTRLIEARIAAELVYSRLQHLPELKAHAYEMGRAQRDHERTMFSLNSEADQTLARVRLEEARQILARLQPAAAPQFSNTPAPPRFDATDIEEALANVSELSDATRQTIGRILRGMMRERAA